MAGQDREGGAFFANTRKTAQNAPDYRGELRVSRELVDNLVQQLASGVQFPALEVSGWRKTSNSGTTYISMSGRKPYVKDGQGGQQQRQAPQGGWGGGSVQSSGWSPSKGNDLDDSIPFAPEWR
jgi:hypothetical protein